MKKILMMIMILGCGMMFMTACGNKQDPNVPENGTNNPGTNNTDNGNTSGDIITGGETGLAAPTGVTLPTNVKMEISMDGNLDQTTIKIGNDYYTKDRYGDEVYFKQNADDQWVKYEKEDGAWSEVEYYDYDEVINECFNNVDRYNDMGADLSTTGRSKVIAGVNTKECKYVLNGTDLFCWISDDGISFNHNDLTIITLWNTSVSSFGFDTP